MSAIEFVLACDEVAGGGRRGVARLLQCKQRIRIDPAVLDNLANECRIVFQVIGRSKLGQLVRLLGACFRRSVPRRSSAGIDAIHERFRNRVGVVAEVVLDVGAGVPNVVSPDGAAVLEVNDFRGRAHHGRGKQEGR